MRWERRWGATVWRSGRRGANHLFRLSPRSYLPVDSVLLERSRRSSREIENDQVCNLF
ncbi:hypothetical protein BN2537_12249 [Streptomyces venezuelae]|nr:hypothetical protein BN2537_12249 [Streptomyces venezuelae]